MLSAMNLLVALARPYLTSPQREHIAEQLEAHAADAGYSPKTKGDLRFAALPSLTKS